MDGDDREMKIEHIEKTTELLVAGLTNRQIFKVLTEKTDWKLTEKEISKLIKSARRLMEKAADIHRKRERGKSIQRLETLYAKSNQIQDYKTCLTAERERIRLLGLAEADPADENGAEPNTAAEKELRQIAAHILPLKLADETLPLVEHVRLAAEKIRACQTK